MEFEIGMRARDDTVVAQDLIPSVPPIAAALHDRFLASRCSACFRPLASSQNDPPPCTACGSSISYCSLTCQNSDVGLHISSGECHVIRLLSQSDPSTWRSGDSSDLRAALRLLRSLETLGQLDTLPGRVGCLSADNLNRVLGEGSESGMGERIREGAALMRRVREAVEGVREEEVLWAVITNAVEVQVSEGAALGVAVYGPWFSWFNHSCSPNACYRLELNRSMADSSCDLDSFRVLPLSNGEVPEVWKTWVYGGSNLKQGLCRFAPRIVVRSIKPIKKGEEVCIAYTDLLQPKAVRHLDLWSKYRFVCCCERCSASPEMYVDHMLNSDARSLVTNYGNSRGTVCDELAELLDETIAEYMSDGNPEEFCRKLENMLSGSFEYSSFKEPLRLTFRLHPLHYLSLNAYIGLSSALKVLSTNLLATALDEESTFKAFEVRRAAAAYSLLLSGATHHLFMSEPSFITSAAVFWVSVGESIMGLLRSSYEGEFDLVIQYSQFTKKEVSFVSLDKCKETSILFLECVSKNLTKSWPYLVQGLSYLENVRSPIDFSWLGITNIYQILDGQRSSSGSCLCCECKINMETHLEEYRSLARLAVCCLTYGRYLAIICWGQQSYLVDSVMDLLHGIS